MSIDIVTPEGAQQQGEYTGFFPKIWSTEDRPPADQYFSRVWQFDGETAPDLSKMLASQSLEMTSWAEGTWDCFCVILWELLDNILEHANTSVGFVEIQVVRGCFVRLAVADAGVGVLRSFQKSSRTHRPRTDLDALTLAIKEGTSSLDDKGRGNGLWLASRVAAAGTADFALESGRGTVYWHAGQSAPGFRPVNRERQSVAPPMTIVVLELDASRPARTIDVLGYEPTVPEREQLLTPAGAIHVPVAEASRGTATRRAGEQLRNYVESLYNQAPAVVELDFSGIAVISMSFADELVGKLAARLGVARFARQVSVINATPLVQGLLDRAVDARFER